MKKSEKKLRTLCEVAKHFGVSETAVYRTRRNFADFPAGQNGGYSIREIRDFLRRNQLWSYRPAVVHSTAGDRRSRIDEARIKKTLEQAENERIRKERALVEQALELGQIVNADDVKSLYVQTVNTVKAIHEGMIEAVDRALPDSPPTADAWPVVRDRVLSIVHKLPHEVASAMAELK